MSIEQERDGIRGDAIYWIAIALGVLGIPSGCASSAPPRPDDLSAAAHRREAARDHAAAARERDSYDPRAVASARLSEEPVGGLSAGYAAPYNPTARHLATAAHLEAHAREHAAAAAELERFEEAECAGLEPHARAACPVIAAASIEVLAGGVRLILRDPSTAERTLALMKCHLAYARTRGFERAPDCPLYLRGVELHGDARAIDVTSRDPAVAREIVLRGAQLADR